MWNQMVPDTISVNPGTISMTSEAHSMDGQYIMTFAAEDDVSVASNFDQSSLSDSMNGYMPNDLAGAGSQYSEPGIIFAPNHGNNGYSPMHDTRKHVTMQALMTQSYNECQMDHPGHVETSMHASSGQCGFHDMNQAQFQGHTPSGDINQSWITTSWNSIDYPSQMSWAHNVNVDGQCVSPNGSGNYKFMAPIPLRNSSSSAINASSHARTQGNTGSDEAKYPSRLGSICSAVNLTSNGPQNNREMDTSVSYEESVTSISSNSSRTRPRINGNVGPTTKVPNSDFNGEDYVGNRYVNHASVTTLESAPHSGAVSVHPRKSRASGSRSSPKERNQTASGASRKDVKRMTPSSSGSETGRRSSAKNEISDARQRVEYQQTPVNGLYHCYFEGQEFCEHPPTKLKCNYDKYIDSHLRPHECREKGCEELRFSSAACKLRHEREAHGSHGHGLNPFLCKYKDCQRSKEGFGFPRSWNCTDHMKRMHDYVSSPSDSASPTHPRDFQATSTQEVQRKRQSDKPQPDETSKKPKNTNQRPGLEPQPNESKLNRLLSRQTELQKEWYQRRGLMKQRVDRVSGPEDAKNIHLLREEVSSLGNLTGLLADIAAQLNRLGYNQD